jgi:putative transposase
MIETISSFDVNLYSYCLMPNHFHLILKPRKSEHLSPWLRLFMTKQVRNYHKRNKTCGHLWQGRYKLFPIQSGAYFDVAMRYVERNALRSNLVNRAEDWKWSSLAARIGGMTEGLSKPPISSGGDWLSWVNQPLTESELVSLRNCVNRCSPYGSEQWTKKKAKELGLESTLRPIGRPRKL